MAQTNTDQPSTVLAPLRERPGLTAATVLATAGLALAAAFAQPVTYTAEARLAVAGGDLAAQAVPGYALASQELAANYARYVNNSDDQGALEEAVELPAGSVASVAASPVPESNVVRIEVDAVDAASATAAAAYVADTLIERVEAASTEEEAASVLAEFTTISTEVAQAEQAAGSAQAAVDAGLQAAAPDLEARRAAAADAAARLSVLRVQQEALAQRYRTLVDTISSVNLTVVEPAAVTGNDRASRAQRYALAGVAAGLLLALALTRRAQRRAAAADAGDGPLLPEPARVADRELVAAVPARR